MKITRGSVLMVLWFAATLASTPLRAAEQEARSLAQRARNPIDPEVSYLIVQNNWLFGMGAGNAGKYKWGVGPILGFPTATDDALGTGKWGAGPAVVGFFIQGRWTVGAQAYYIWPYAGAHDRPDVGQFLFQYDITYCLGRGWCLLSTPIITDQSEESSGDTWAVPFGGGIGKLVPIDRVPTFIAVQGFYNVVKPEQKADWSLRLQFKFLFSK